ncbi:DDB1- and CUL4-associated factor 8 isoform X1 [Onthophagus taurus]|uniref:DDB1- and CUL4-associated factor 8 isoform X1 n=1 Tax=Onthophagus taurus TaxID=166361 RepID=UPI0039BDED70
MEDCSMSEDDNATDTTNQDRGDQNVLIEEPQKPQEDNNHKTELNCIIEECQVRDSPTTSSSNQNNTIDKQENENVVSEENLNNPSEESPDENNRKECPSTSSWYLPSENSSDETSPFRRDCDMPADRPDSPAVLSKEKPKHNWFIVKEVLNRQLGGPSKLRPELFYSRCYGSLHCVQRLELMYKLEFHQGCVNSLNFNADGSLLASGSDDLKVAIWNWKCGQKLLSFDTKHRGNVFQSKFLPLDGDLHIATCSRDGQVRLAQVSKQEGLRSTRKLGSHRGPCHKLAVLKDQPQIVLSAGEDGIIFRHDIRNSKPDRVTHVKDCSREVALYSINSHPLNPNEFCVGGRDHMVRTFDQRNCGPSVKPLKCYNPFETIDRLPYHVTCAVYNHNGSEILATYNDENIYLFDINGNEGKYLHQYMGHRNGATIKGVNFFGPNSEFIVSGSDCGNVFFWDRNTEAIVQYFCADNNGVVNCLEPHPQVPYICTSGLDWDVKVWVPSYEFEPELKGLSDTVRENVSAASQWSYNTEMSGYDHTLWVLWRRVSSFQRMPYDLGFRGWIDLSSDIISSSSSNNLGSDSNSDSGGDAPPNCTTS